MSNHINKKVIVRCNRAGVFFGILKEFDSTTREATLSNVRRIWYWNGAASLSEMAVNGVARPQDCKFTVVVPEMDVMEVIEIIPASNNAIKSIESVPVWKY